MLDRIRRATLADGSLAGKRPHCGAGLRVLMSVAGANLEEKSMKPPVAFVVLLLAATSAATSLPPPAAAQAGPVALAAHRAVYDLKLATTRGKRPMEAVR